MPQAPSPWSSILVAIVLLELPVAAALGILVAVGHLDGTAAFLAFLGIGAVSAVVIRPHVRGVARLTAFIDALADGEDMPQPSPAWPPLATALASAVGRLRRRAQQRREDMAARLAALEAVLDSLPDPVITLDDRLRVARCNTAAKELLAEDPVGRDLSTVLRIPSLLDAAQSALRRGVGARAEFELARPVRRWFVARVERVAGSVGGEVSLIAALHDLTAEKRAEQMRADFVANASHELRTPLATLLGFIETLQGPASQDPRTRERFLAIMQQQASRMSRLVDDLLSLSRIELREHTAPTEQIEILGVLRSVIDALQPLSLARGMNITLDLNDEAPPHAVGDSDELAQVFQNLIDNALKYGRRGTTVRVSARHVDRCPIPINRVPQAGLVAVAVADEGEGIPAEQIPRLTERFYRVDAARSRELGGTGLGLAIVKHIVNHHRGALQIASDIGVGSEFTVFLPATGVARRAEEDSNGPSLGHGTVTSS
jgi:two-component system phosphate regulon sensor histidine kinase PhoR